MTARATSTALATLAALAGVVAAPAAGAPIMAPAPTAPATPEAGAPPSPPRDPEYEVTYLYNLSTNFGTLPMSNVQLSYDREHHELFVTGDGPVRVFNDSGMETYTFGNDPELGYVVSIASIDGGDLVALTVLDGKVAIARCSFRGEFRELIEPHGVPEEYAHFAPSVLRYVDGKIFLADLAGMRVLVVDASGAYAASYDLAEKLGEAKHRADLGLRGFNVDRQGNILFTIQPLFRAYTMTPEGEITPFGQKGSAPGKFNIVGGIARDDAGNYYVADILKSAILVFDRDFVWRKEFGFRSAAPSGLAAPEDLAAAGSKIFISNRARRGVSVFEVVAK